MSITKKITYLKSLGMRNSVHVILDRLLSKRSVQYHQLRDKFKGVGLEFGGPSKVFSVAGYCPVYEDAKRVDNLNFAAVTKWHGAIDSGSNYFFNPRKEPGVQRVPDSGTLSMLRDASYDFILSSHMLEHTANPLKQLVEWNRVLKIEGILMLVLPHKDGTFDRKRPLTSTEHFLDDFENNTLETDTTHLEEILKLHDLSLDKAQNSPVSFKSWIENNHANRGAHHHVFNSVNAARLVDLAGFKILDVEPRRPFDIFIFAEKLPANQRADNSRFFADLQLYLCKSPFRSDHDAVQ